MEQTDRIYLSKIAPLFRYGRKSLGKNQVEFSTDLNMSQAHISKVEAAKSMPTAVQLLEFARLANIPLVSFNLGHLDFPKFVKTRTIPPNSYLQLDKRYRIDQGSTIRSLQPLLNFTKGQYGSGLLKKFYKKMKVDYDYFTNWDNLINVSFSFDLMIHLIRDNRLKSNNLQQLTSLSRDPESLGSLHKLYDQANGSMDLIHIYLLNIKKYQVDFNYQIEDIGHNYLTFSMVPEDHTKYYLKKYSNVLGDFLSAYHKSWLQEFSNYKGREGVIIEQKECCFTGSPRSVYQISPMANM